MTRRKERRQRIEYNCRRRILKWLAGCHETRWDELVRWSYATCPGRAGNLYVRAYDYRGDLYAADCRACDGAGGFWTRDPSEIARYGLYEDEATE